MSKRSGKRSVQYKTLSSSVVETIGHWIIDGTLKKGQRIVIKNIATELGVSEMPVREALKVLEAQGLVTSIPYRGTWVTQLSAHDIEELYMLRGILESKAAGLAVERITDEEIRELEHLAAKVEQAIANGDAMRYVAANQKFHLTLYAASGCVHLVSHIEMLWKTLAYYRLVYSTPFMIHHAVEEHTKYLDACRRHDVAYAEELARTTLQDHVEYLVSQLNVADVPWKDRSKGGDEREEVQKGPYVSG